ncbi:uncharacterized protein LOC103524116 [Trichonephila clavipes]|nr:uncharacterized protein LOC103524116 [Trichonephila clavipes]
MQKKSFGNYNTRFPPEDWLHIYTDGSLLDFAQGAGIGVFSHLFSFYLHAGPLTTHFDGEVEAIHIALQQLAVRLPPIERAVILSDSTSALQALSNYNENNCLRVQNCRELLGKIKGKIVFQWVPSHCGLWGNKRADFLAKKGTGILQNFRRDLTLHSAKLEIKRIFRESFRLTASRVARDKPWSTLCKKSHGIPSSPRAAAVAKFRLLTGHNCLCAHLFQINLVTSPICVLCDTGQYMTAAHLDECSAMNDLNCIVKREGFVDINSAGNHHLQSVHYQERNDMFHIIRPSQVGTEGYLKLVFCRVHWLFLKYETPVPEVEVLIVRISVAAGRIRDMTGIFQNVRNSMLYRCQLCQITSERNFKRLLMHSLSIKYFLSHQCAVVSVPFFLCTIARKYGICDSAFLCDYESAL